MAFMAMHSLRWRRERSNGNADENILYGRAETA
jgi:hypothetical protein